MAETRRRPTRRDLIVIIARLQHHFSGASMYANDETQDPGPCRGEIELGFNLCLAALDQEAPVDMTRGPWGTAEANQRRLAGADD